MEATPNQASPGVLVWEVYAREGFTRLTSVVCPL